MLLPFAVGCPRGGFPLTSGERRRVFKGEVGKAFCSGALQFTLIRSDSDLIYLASYIYRSEFERPRVLKVLFPNVEMHNDIKILKYTVGFRVMESTRL